MTTVWVKHVGFSKTEIRNLVKLYSKVMGRKVSRREAAKLAGWKV
jgi:hypothetical protein